MFHSQNAVHVGGSPFAKEQRILFNKKRISTLNTAGPLDDLARTAVDSDATRQELAHGEPLFEYDRRTSFRAQPGSQHASDHAALSRPEPLPELNARCSISARSVVLYDGVGGRAGRGAKFFSYASVAE